MPASFCPAKALPADTDKAKCDTACPTTSGKAQFVLTSSSTPNVCLLGTDCPDGYFGNTATKECTPCAVANCASCAAGDAEAAAVPDTCQACLAGFFISVSVCASPAAMPVLRISGSRITLSRDRSCAPHQAHFFCVSLFAPAMFSAPCSPSGPLQRLVHMPLECLLS